MFPFSTISPPFLYLSLSLSHTHTHRQCRRLPYGFTDLVLALRRNFPDKIRTIDYACYQPIHLACQRHHASLMNALLDLRWYPLYQRLMMTWATLHSNIRVARIICHLSNVSLIAIHKDSSSERWKRSCWIHCIVLDMCDIMDRGDKVQYLLHKDPSFV